MFRELVPPLATRERRDLCSTVVLHATAGRTLHDAIHTLRKRGLSYHILIDKDGTLWKCCEFGRVAFHAGISRGPRGRYVNNYSVGISFVNMNNGIDPYTESQYAACIAAIKQLKKQFPHLRWLTTHYYISPGRKTDPRSFEVKRVANAVMMPIWKPLPGRKSNVET